MLGYISTRKNICITLLHLHECMLQLVHVHKCMRTIVETKQFIFQTLYSQYMLILMFLFCNPVVYQIRVFFIFVFHLYFYYVHVYNYVFVRHIQIQQTTGQKMCSNSSISLTWCLMMSPDSQWTSIPASSKPPN